MYFRLNKILEFCHHSVKECHNCKLMQILYHVDKLYVSHSLSHIASCNAAKEVPSQEERSNASRSIRFQRLIFLLSALQSCNNVRFLSYRVVRKRACLFFSFYPGANRPDRFYCCFTVRNLT